MRHGSGELARFFLQISLSSTGAGALCWNWVLVNPDLHDGLCGWDIFPQKQEQHPDRMMWVAGLLCFLATNIPRVSLGDVSLVC